MIDSEKIEKKFKPLNDRIQEVNLKLGIELSDELISRIEIAIDSFFEEFKSLSTKSFARYWNQVQKNKDIKFLEDSYDKNPDINSKEKITGIPKFISDYDKNKNKK